MKVSFTGNHLFTFRNKNIRDLAYNTHSDNKSYTCRVGNKQLLVLDGKELEDFNRVQTGNLYIKEKDFRNELLKAYINSSIKVDLSNAQTY